jgi:hypothetical protein
MYDDTKILHSQYVQIIYVTQIIKRVVGFKSKVGYIQFKDVNIYIIINICLFHLTNMRFCRILQSSVYRVKRRIFK